MRYRIIYSQEARLDLRAIYTYIAEKLYAPETAARQANRIMDAIDGLEEVPERFALCDVQPWRSQGLRFIPIDNYLVFYQVREEDGTAYIVRIMYGGRNIQEQLQQEPSTRL